MTKHSFLKSVLAGSALAILAAFPAAARDKVVLSLAWSIGGSQNGVFLGIDRGYFAEEGIDLEVVPGNGSSNTVNRVASGAFQFGVGDIPSIVRFNAMNPETKVKAIYNQQPTDLAFVTLKGRNITKPEDLKGKIIGAPTGDTAYKMFPAFSTATGIKASDLKWEHMAPNVREVMLIRGQVDAITANQATALFALKSAGVKESDIVFIMYPDVGVKLAGGGVMATEALIKKNPDLVARFVRAYSRSAREGFADTAAAVDATLKREVLLKRDLEMEKAGQSHGSILGQELVKQKGLGAFSEDIIQGTIDTMTATESLTTKLQVSDIIEPGFLPQLKDRTAPVAAVAAK